MRNVSYTNHGALAVGDPGAEGLKAGKGGDPFHYPVVMICSLRTNEPVSVGGEMCGDGNVWDGSSEEDGRWMGTVRFRPHMGLRLKG